eukprot:3935252-Rhodomonas_salina.1
MSWNTREAAHSFIACRPISGERGRRSVIRRQKEIMRERRECVRGGERRGEEWRGGKREGGRSACEMRGCETRAAQWWLHTLEETYRA